LPASSREEIRAFLQEVKAVVSQTPSLTRFWRLVDRRENLDFMATVGLTRADIGEAILGLSVEDYCEGPMQDHTEPGDVWVFGKAISGKETYIKLKLAVVSIVKIVRVISFHEANQPLRYPFKQAGKAG